MVKLEKQRPVAFTATPRIGTDGQVVLQDVHYVPELTAALVARVSEVLSLRSFESRGCHCEFSSLM